MSQAKTIIPGLEPDGGNYENSQMVENANYYARDSHQPRGTIVPEMLRKESANNENQERRAKDTILNNSGKPIVGFLYSISRTSMGEFWPLQIGRNTIGQSVDCDICLPEGTVSSNHAVIVTRLVKDGMIAAITDAQSTNGTKINGEAIGFTPEECHDGDVITIGNHYELLLILIDSAKRGLSLSKEFIPVEVGMTDHEEFIGDPVIKSGRDTSGEFDPYRKTILDRDADGFYSSAKGTVGFDGSTSGDKPGGTIAM